MRKDMASDKSEPTSQDEEASSSERVEMAVEKYYRYESIRYAAPVDEFDNPCGTGRIDFLVREYPVIKKTAQGVWIDVYGKKRFVLSNTNKKFAAPTIEAARESFIARKNKQVKILKAQLDMALETLQLVNGAKAESVTIVKWPFLS